MDVERGRFQERPLADEIVDPTDTLSRLKATTASQLSDGLGDQPTPRLAMNQLTTFRWPLEEAVVGFAKAGFAGIGLWRPRLADYGEERTAELIRDSGLAVSSLSFTGGFTGSHGFRYCEAVSDGQEAIHQAAIVGAETVIVVAGGLNGHITKHARRNVVDGLKHLADDAAEQGVKLALRPMRAAYHHTWSCVNTLDDTMHILDRVDHPALGIALDVYHCGVDENWHDALQALAPKVYSVFLNDIESLHAGEYEMCLPGQGILPVRTILSQLLRGGYNGFFEVHVWSEALWQHPPDDLLPEIHRAVSELWSH